MCKECQSIDPAPRKLVGEQGLSEVRNGHHSLWYHHFLMLTDCCLSYFSIWKQLVRQDLASIIRQLMPSGPRNSSYRVGDHVWVKVLQNWCTTKFSWGHNNEDVESNSLPMEGPKAEPHFSSFTKKHPSKTTTTRLLSLWSWDQGAV